MSEAKDPAIKLFGKTIPLQEIAAGSGTESSGGPSSAGGAGEYCNRTDLDPSFADNYSSENKDEEEREVDKDDTLERITNEPTKKKGISQNSKNCTGQNATSAISENPITPSNDNDTAILEKSSRTEEDQSDTSLLDEKTLKKPDKIIPCPRCNSMDTKFCYYNNYNVNQPRHFCRNCQRYWTAGGTMRNVPVGAGRRKHKNSSPHYQHLTVPEALKPNGTVLAFSSDSPLCESMTSVLNLTEKTRNGFNKQEEFKNGDEKLSEFSHTRSNSKDESMQEDLPLMPNGQGLTPQIPCYPGAALWPYTWNPPVQWNNPLVPPPVFCPPPGYPMPYFWGCAVPGAWNIPWIPNPSSPNSLISNSGPNSPLGKHSRSGDLFKPSVESTSERSVLIPKTLRIDDPGEAAKSSIWETLGIKNEIGEKNEGKEMFKAFQSKGIEKNHRVVESSPVLQANPAALYRSHNFHESS